MAPVVEPGTRFLDLNRGGTTGLLDFKISQCPLFGLLGNFPPEYLPVSKVQTGKAPLMCDTETGQQRLFGDEGQTLGCCGLSAADGRTENTKSPEPVGDSGLQGIRCCVYINYKESVVELKGIEPSTS